MSGATAVEITAEQAVFGSFPFWDRGYALLAHSSGCSPAWLDAFRAACGRFGERPRGVADAGGLFALPIPDGPWMIVGVSGQGRDDRGRPGALAFHALFVEAKDYRRLGASPFPLAGFHQGEWDPATTALERLTLAVDPEGEPDPGGGPDGRAASIAGLLARGQRVAIEASAPIDALARAVWRALPPKARRQATVATWAFDNANGFDLVGLPRPGAATPAVGAAAGAVAAAGAELAGETPSAVATRRRPDARVLLAALVGFGAVLGWLAPRIGRLRDGDAAGPVVAPAVAPARELYRAEPPDAELRARVTSGLADLAERFGLGRVGGSEPGPGPWMVRIAEGLRYRGPLLSAAERDRLAHETGPGRARALAWDAQIRRFVPDRPLPADFARGPLRWQLDALAWSFHLDGVLDPHLAPAEVAPALAHALALDEPVRPNPLAPRYPALSDYARFLDALPRR